MKDGRSYPSFIFEKRPLYRKTSEKQTLNVTCPMSRVTFVIARISSACFLKHFCSPSENGVLHSMGVLDVNLADDFFILSSLYTFDEAILRPSLALFSCAILREC